MLSLLRGINVAGQKKVKMADLKKLYEEMGCENVRTYIQSGNVVFEGGAEISEGEIEKAILKEFGFEVKVVNRSKEEMELVVKNNPFKKLDEARRKEFSSKRTSVERTSCVYVTFLAEAVAESVMEKIAPFASGAEEIVMSESGREIYLNIPDGYGRTKLSNALIERKCGVAATTRNWRTVGVLRGMMD